MSDDGEETVPGENGAGEETVTGERRAGVDQAERVPTAPRTEGEAVEAGVESFLELESDLQTAGRVRGRAVDVERVGADAVPADYPLTITTEEAIALTLVVDEETGEETTVYFEFDGHVGDRLARLLELLDIQPERFAALHGRTVLLDAEDGHHVPVVPPTRPRGDARGVYVILAGLVGNALFGALAVAGVALPIPVVLTWLLLNMAIPVATYLDARHLRTTTDWGQGPGFWALLAVIPGVNVLSSVAYLLTRRRADPLA